MSASAPPAAVAATTRSPRSVLSPATAAAAVPHSIKPYKNPGKRLHNQYALTLEVSFVVALLVLVGLFHLPVRSVDDFEIEMRAQEVVQMEEIINTQQDQPPPPPPPAPRTVTVVSDDALLEDVELDLDASLEIDEPLADLPPPPPPPEEEEQEEDVEPEVFVIVEEPPELIGGLEAIQRRIKYPEVALRAGLEGRVIVQFIVDENGNVMDPFVIRGLGGGCDEEAIRAIKEAKFKPGRQRGKAVRVRYVIPIKFSLQDAPSS